MTGLSMSSPLSGAFNNVLNPSAGSTSSASPLSALTSAGKSKEGSFQAKKSSGQTGGKSMDEMFADKTGQIMQKAMRAVEANTKMKEAAAAADATEQWLGKALAMVGRKMEGLMKFMGAKPEDIAKFHKDFTDHYDPEKVEKRYNLNRPTALTEASSSSLQISLEMRDIDLEVAAGNKSIAIHFEAASFSLKSDTTQIQIAQYGAGGPVSVGMQQQSMSVMLGGNSLDVSAEGLSESEMKQLNEAMPQLYNALAKGGEITAVFAGQGGADTPASSGVFQKKDGGASASSAATATATGGTTPASADPDALHLSLGITMPVPKQQPQANTIASLFSGGGLGNGLDLRL